MSIAFSALGLNSNQAHADRLVLRNLKIISDRSVKSWNEDGVQLSDGTSVRWDEIERGTIDKDRQAAFNKMLQELGSPLFQVRQRLSKGDYEGLLEPAEEMYPRYKKRNSETSYMVFQSLMWGRLAAGRREAAVEPYLRCFEYLRHAPGGDRSLAGRRRLQTSKTTAISVELTPIWFDAAAAKAAMPGVLEAVAQMREPRPEGARIYYATLALTAGETDTAEKVLKGLHAKRREIAELWLIVQAQQEIFNKSPGKAVTRLKNSVESLLTQNKPVALYWLGLSGIETSDRRSRREGVLQLLRLPALYGNKFPELAGAGLYHSMIALDQLNNPRGSVAVRRELLVRYGQTVHAAKVKRASSGSK